MRIQRFILAILGLAFLAGIAAAQEMAITVHAGDFDRIQTPVRVVVDVPATAKSVTLTDGKGNTISAQLTGPGILDEAAAKEGKAGAELHFILPKLEKGKSETFKAVFSSDEPKETFFEWKTVPNDYSVLLYENQPVVRYMRPLLDRSSKEAAQASFRMFHHVYDLATGQRLTKGPGGLHQHHRGLFFSYNHITYDGDKQCNPWAGPGYDDAYEFDAGTILEEAGPVLGRHVVAIEWRANESRAVAKEARQLTVYSVPGGTIIDFATDLKTCGGKVKLDGNAQHAGFQIRAHEEVAGKTAKQTYYLRPDGKGDLGKVRNPDAKEQTDACKNEPWKAMSFVVAGKRYTMLYIDSPSNPKPSRYSERDYGRFGSYFKYELDEGKNLQAKYRVWIQSGEMTLEEAQSKAADVATPVKVECKTL